MLPSATTSRVRLVNFFQYNLSIWFKCSSTSNLWHLCGNKTLFLQFLSKIRERESYEMHLCLKVLIRNLKRILLSYLIISSWIPYTIDSIIFTFSADTSFSALLLGPSLSNEVKPEDLGRMSCDVRCQFHQHYTSAFFIWKWFLKLFSNYSSAWYFFGDYWQKSCL